MRHGRQVRRQLGDLAGRDRNRDSVVEQRLAQLGDQAHRVPGREEIGINTERLRQLQKHRHRQRAVIALDLVQIARRDLQQPRELSLAETTILAEVPQARANEHFLHGWKPSQIVVLAIA